MPAGGVSTLFAQRLSPMGAPLWDMNGKRLSDARNPVRNTNAIPDGEGGAVLRVETRIPQPPASIICGMWGFSASDIFAVGETGPSFASTV